MLVKLSYAHQEKLPHLSEQPACFDIPGILVICSKLQLAFINYCNHKLPSCDGKTCVSLKDNRSSKVSVKAIIK